MTTPTASPAASADILGDADYHRLSAAVLAGIEATVDAWLEGDVIDIDSHRTGGLLELSFPDGSKLIVNTQPPLQELWLASRAGGFHFKCVGGQWRDTRSGGEFFAVLSAQASAQGGRALSFEAAPQG
jgi:CyaY protein